MANPDKLSVAMQSEAIKISEQRLGKSLSAEIEAKIQQPRSYMGLEIIIDTVRAIEVEELERYLTDLDKYD